MYFPRQSRIIWSTGLCIFHSSLGFYLSIQSSVLLHSFSFHFSSSSSFQSIQKNIVCFTSIQWRPPSLWITAKSKQTRTLTELKTSKMKNTLKAPIFQLET